MMDKDRIEAIRERAMALNGSSRGYVFDSNYHYRKDVPYLLAEVESLEGEIKLKSLTHTQREEILLCRIEQFEKTIEYKNLRFVAMAEENTRLRERLAAAEEVIEEYARYTAVSLSPFTGSAEEFKERLMEKLGEWRKLKEKGND